MESIALGVPGICCYELDEQLTVVGVDDGWREFALANGAPSMIPPPGPLGQSVLAFIADATTAQLYEHLFQRSRATNSVITVPFRCDAPGIRRSLELTIAPQPDSGFVVTSTTIRTENRTPVELFASNRPHSDAQLTACGWCKRVNVQGRWCEVEDAVAELRLFDEAVLPMVSHGICPRCFDEMSALLDR